MIKVSVMYPNQPGVRFDHDYYRTKHLPLIKSRMGAALKYYTIDKALMDAEGKPLGAYVGDKIALHAHWPDIAGPPPVFVLAGFAVGAPPAIFDRAVEHPPEVIPIR